MNLSDDNPAQIWVKTELNQWLAEPDLRQLQLARVNALLRWAVERVPFYRRQLASPTGRAPQLESLDELTTLPILSKGEIQANLEQMQAQGVPRDRWIRDATGGSTGEPLVFFRDPVAQLWIGAATERFRRWMGYLNEDKLALIWGADRDFPPDIPPTQKWLNVFNCREDDLERFILELLSWKPRAIRGYAGSLHLVAQFIKSRGLPPVRPHVIESAAETLSSEMRRDIEEAFGAPVFNLYGSREIPCIACEDASRSGLRVADDVRLVEVIRSGRPAAPGEAGSLVITDLANRAMPFVRYEIGDIATAGQPSQTEASCAFSRIEHLLGRTANTITAPDGRLVHGEFFTHLFYQKPGVRMFQVRQASNGNIEVSIVPGNGFRGELIEKIVSEMRQHLGVTESVTWKTVAQIPPSATGKRLFTISEIPVQFARSAHKGGSQVLSEEQSTQERPLMTSPLQWTPELLRRFWAYQARTNRTNYFAYQVGGNVLAGLRDYFPPAARVLDYGAGLGFLTEKSLEMGFTTTAADISPESVDDIRARFTRHPHFAGAYTIEELLARRDRFQVIFVTEVVEHVYDKELRRILHDVRRFLTDDGVAIFTTPNSEDLRSSMVYCPVCDHEYHRMQHVRAWTLVSLADHLQGEDLEVVDAFTTNFCFLPLEKDRVANLTRHPHLVCLAKLKNPKAIVIHTENANPPTPCPAPNNEARSNLDLGHVNAPTATELVSPNHASAPQDKERWDERSHKLGTGRSLNCAILNSSPSQTQFTGSGPSATFNAKPHLLLIADVPNWIFERHCRKLAYLLGKEFQFTVKMQGQPYREEEFDLIYPLEWNLVPKEWIKTPAKYVTGIRSHTSWKDQDFMAFTEFLATHFQQVHVVSRRLEKLFKPFLPSVCLLSHGVDTEFFKPTSSATRSPAGRLRLGWAGNRINPTKGFEQFVAPLAKLPGVELCFCGYLDKNLNLEQMRRFYDSIDAYICSSHQEGNNNSLLEAGAMERAIITTANGTVPEYLVDRESALIVERELPELIRAVIELRDSPERRALLGRAARLSVQRHFEWHAMAERHALFFRQALAGRNTWQKPSSALSTFAPPAAVKLMPAPAAQSNPLEELLSEAGSRLAGGDLAGTRSVLEHATERFPADAVARESLANICFQMQDFETATQHYRRLTELQADSASAWLKLAHAALRLNRVDEFEAALGRSLSLDPENCDALRFLGDLNFQNGSYADAVDVYTRILRRAPQDLEVLLMLGNSYFKLGKRDSAKVAYQTILSLDPKHQVAAENLSFLQPSPSSTAPRVDSTKFDHVACPFCGSRQADTFRRSADIVRCGQCSTIYLRTRHKVEVLEEIYQTYADDGSHMRLPKSPEEASQSCLKRDYFLKEILQFTKPGGRFLDVGCGWGAFLLNARDHGFEPVGMELTRKAVRYANEQLRIPVVNTQFLDTHYEADSLQVVTMNHVFEHLPFPKQALEKVFRVLKPGGVFCGIVPNIDSFCAETLGEQWFWLDPNYHYVHYTPATLRKHLEAAGFQVQRLYTATGDYGSRAVREAALKRHPELADDDKFNRWLEKTNCDLHGEELRFFARKPLQSTVSSAEPQPKPVPAQMPGDECPVSTREREIKARLVEASHAIEVLNWRKAREFYVELLALAKADQGLVAVLQSAIGRLDHLIQCGAAQPALIRPPGVLDGFSFCIITNGKRPEKLRREIDSIRALGIPNFEILVGGEVPEALEGVTVVPVPDAARGGRLGEMRNRLVERARFEHLVVADDDLVFLPNFYDGLIRFGDDYQVQCVRFLNPDGTRYWDWATNSGPRGHCLLPYDEADPHVYVTGGLCIMKAEVARRVKWDERRGFYQGEDADFSTRLRQAGIQIKCNPYGTVIHHDTRYTQFGKIVLTAQSLHQTARDTLKQGRFEEADQAFQTLRLYSPETVVTYNQFVLDAFVAKRDGRFSYFDAELLPEGVAGAQPLANLACVLARVFSQVGPFYLHFGGAGDALLLLATFLDQHPDAQVVSFPNSIPATRSFFEAFPSLSRIWFLPKSSNPRIHLLLRMMMKKVPNCKGMGVTPEQDYWQEWHSNLDIFKEFGVSTQPRWAQKFRTQPETKQVALAPKGSLQGMVGSKRNIIEPAVWPRLIQSLQERGFQPAIIGTPEEANDYPCLAGCLDRRSYSFVDQIRCIANSSILIGADSWAKTFSALAGIPTIVFESLKGADWAGKKDASDFVFLDPWKTITVVKDLAACEEVFVRKAAVPAIGVTSAPRKPTSSALPSGPIRLAWEGSFLDFGSLSFVNREMTRCLSRSTGVDLTRVGEPGLRNGATNGRQMKALSPVIAKVAPMDCQVTVRHSWPPNWAAKHRGALVVIQPWEFGALPEQWVRQSALVQQFWVPSRYVRDVYVSSGVPAEKVKVVPNGIDPEQFHSHAAPRLLVTKKSFKFLFVGGTIPRKGADVLLQTYLKSFTAKDDVCLVIKDFGGQSVYCGQTLEKQIEAARSKTGAPEILYLNTELSPEELPGLYTACDCLVHPYRGEGFGLPILEAMACGLPVIVTAGGAADDFATEQFAYRIPATRRTIGDTISGMRLTSPGWLLEPDATELASRMKWVVERRDEARQLGKRASEYARREWTWEKAARIAAERLKELAAGASGKKGASQPSQSKAVKVATVASCGLVGKTDKAREALIHHKPKEAWELVGSALKMRPYHPEGLLLTAEIAASTGDGQVSRKLAERARNLAPDWKPARQFLNRKLKGSSGPAWLLAEDLLKKDAARLTVCIIAKNEERFIGQCLASIKAIASQIVVVDTGSTDKTVEMAKSFGAEVHSFEWCDDFSAARNAALEHARGDWVLVLDADEELPPDQHARLLADLKNPKVIALRLPLVNKGQETEGRSFVPRLFRNAPGVYFTGRIHEQVFPSLVALGKAWGLNTGLGTAEILHHGYSKETVQDRNKVERNLNLLQKAIAENPHDANLEMNLGLELVRSDKLDEGMRHYRRAFELMSGKPAGETAPELREAFLTQFTCHLYKIRAHEEVVQVLTSLLAGDAGLTASLHFALGLAYFELGRHREAAEQMRQCIAKRQKQALTPINTDILTAAPYHCLAMSLSKSGDAAGAEKAFQSALGEKGREQEVRLDYARFLNEQKRPVEALQCLHQLVSAHANCAVAWRLGGQIALSQPEFLEFAGDWTSEGCNQLPQDNEMLAQRAETLMLTGQTAEAGKLWQAVCGSGRQPRSVAALLICELAESGSVSDSDSSEPEFGPISRAFIDWYQRGLAMRAQSLIARLNDRVGQLRQVLPAAAGMLEAALTEAGDEADTAAEACLV